MDTSEEDEDVDSTTALQNGFAGVVLFKKETEDKSGNWDSIHVFEVVPQSKINIYTNSQPQLF